MIKINLLPVKAAKKKERIYNQLILGALVIVLALFLIGWRYQHQKNRISAVQEEITKTEAKIQKLQEAKKKYEELQKKSKILDQQLQAITDLDTGRDWFIRVLDKISESTPRNQVWISSLTLGSSGRGGGGEEAITIKGSSYDRDAIAHFMGNLSIISCDDELPDEEKAEICVDRNNQCRRWNDKEEHWEWDPEGCRRFYKNTCDAATSCSEDIKACESNQRITCQDPQRKNDCQEVKTKCASVRESCQKSKGDCAKLLEKQFIIYDSIGLSYISLGKEGKSGVPTFNFELKMRMAPPRGPSQ